MGKKLSRDLCYVVIGLIVAICLATVAVAQDDDKPSANEPSKIKSSEKKTFGANDADPGVTKILHLTNATAPTEMQDIVNTLRTITEIRRVTMLPGQDAIVIRGTAEQVALSEKLAAELDSSVTKFGNQYRVEIKLSELEDGKKLGAKSYALVADPRERATLRIGTKPAASSKTGESASGDAPQSIEGWQTLECQIRSETGKDVILRLDFDFFNAPAGGASSQNRIVPRIQVANQFRLELGKTTPIANFDLSESKRSFEVEATVTRIKAKP